ncbi:T9SS type A sorting domain-containing protein, partial [candidate division KSB1 bacterium]|nr:T9SS type A sorting domain-containing protein [candidate division KSB1 bacterium]
CGPHRQPYAPKSRPTVVLNLQDGLEAPLDGSVILTAQTSPNVERVEYYYQWHFLGESRDRDNGFAFEWNLNNYYLRRGNLTITAKAFDIDGQVSRPDEGVSAQIKLVAASSVDEPQGSLPTEFRLGQNYPNPFNPQTTIHYRIPVMIHVTLEVFDVTGRKVETLVNGMRPAGSHVVPFAAFNIPGGAYFYILTSADYSAVRKMLVIK